MITKRSAILLTAIFVGAIIGIITISNSAANAAGPSSPKAVTLINLYKTGYEILKKPTASDNTYMWQQNTQGGEVLKIALADPRVQQILDEVKGKAAQIQGDYPLFSIVNECIPLMPCSAGDAHKAVFKDGFGDVIITANTAVDSSKPGLAKGGSMHECHQQLWHIIVDMNAKKITDIQHPAAYVEAGC